MDRSVLKNSFLIVSALKWWPHYKLRRLDAVILTHPHADAINGLDDLRAWTLQQAIQDCIPIYLTNDTLESVKNFFPYLIDHKMATGTSVFHVHAYFACLWIWIYLANVLYVDTLQFCKAEGIYQVLSGI